MDRGPSKLQRCGLLLRNLLIALLAYSSVVGLVHLYRTGSVSPFTKAPPRPPAIVESSLSGGVNWALRPETRVKVINDAFLGDRPHVDTYANYTRLLDGCRGSYTGLEKMRNVFGCLSYLANNEKDYYFMPKQAPSVGYPAIESAAKPSRKSIGECPGPVQLFHTYWTGPSTWRVELFVKSYLYTQNLACSRLYLWLDSDTNPSAVADMMKDPGFEKFLPLVERGDLMLKAWNFPSKIPLPKGTIAKDPLYAGYLTSRGEPAKTPKGDIYVGDGVVIQSDGSEWIVFTERQMTFLPVAVSDAVRFVVLHLYGGVYLDMDILLLRDMRPLLLTPDHNFAERWAAHSHPGDFNTAVLALNANSSLSSYLVRGGVRMGLNFHPRIVGRMAWKDGRVQELAMFETGLFDPIWGEFNWQREGRCTVPCLKDYGMAFLGTREAVKEEWQSYDGPQLELKAGLEMTQPAELRRRALQKTVAAKPLKGENGKYGGKDYSIDDDKYPPNNRTMENFFRGAWSYHIHNQWTKHYQPNSWFDVIARAQDDFFRGVSTNPYGEIWAGPDVATYQRWPEFD